MTQSHLIWLDLEMTGLEIERDHIIEIATLVTDTLLNIVAYGPVIAIHQPDTVLEAMQEWPKQTHQLSGLTNRVKSSTWTTEMAETETIRFLQQWGTAGISPLCGNSVHMDRAFLRREMPHLHDFFHYRNIDVSTLKELVRYWYPDAIPFQKNNTHTALKDIEESVAELKYYQQKFFIPCS